MNDRASCAALRDAGPRSPHTARCAIVIGTVHPIGGVLASGQHRVQLRVRRGRRPREGAVPARHDPTAVSSAPVPSARGPVRTPPWRAAALGVAVAAGIALAGCSSPPVDESSAIQAEPAATAATSARERSMRAPRRIPPGAKAPAPAAAPETIAAGSTEASAGSADGPADGSVRNGGAVPPITAVRTDRRQVIRTADLAVRLSVPPARSDPGTGEDAASIAKANADARHDAAGKASRAESGSSPRPRAATWKAPTAAVGP